MNKIKDWLGVRRKFNVSLYGIGYMGNAFHVKDITIFNSRNYIDKQGINKIALRHISRKTLIYPGFFALITSD